MVFLTFFNLSVNFAIRNSWSEPQSALSYFCWLYRASTSLATKNIIHLISVLTIGWCPSVELSLVLLEEGVCCDQYLFIYSNLYTDILWLPCPSPSPRVCPRSCPLHWLCHPACSSADTLFSFYPQSFPSIRDFSSESALHLRWPKSWSFNLSISPSNEYSGLISFKMDCFDLLAVQGILKSLL